MDDYYLRKRIITSKSVKSTILYKNIAILLKGKHFINLSIIFDRYYN